MEMMTTMRMMTMMSAKRSNVMGQWVSYFRIRSVASDDCK